jgi:thymidylate kinase
MVDGPDCAGKSTIVQGLKDHFNFRLIKQPVSKSLWKSCIEENSEVFNHILAQFGDVDMIVDRGFPSSFVYSKVFKRKYNLSYVKDCVKFYKDLIIIHVTCSEDVLNNRYTLRWDKVIKWEELMKIRLEYIDFFKKQCLGFKVVEIDTSIDSPETSIEKAISKIEEIKKAKPEKEKK